MDRRVKLASHDAYSDHLIREVLGSVRTIAVLGASPKPSRASSVVMKFLIDKGYGVYPINPGRAGGDIAGRQVFARLSDVPVAIDMVDVFRSLEAIPAVAEEILALRPLTKVVWLQLGLRDDATIAPLEAAGIRVVQDRCPKIELERLVAD